MSGIQSLIIPVALGIVGGVCNFLYLSGQATKMETESFVAISSEAQINSGDLFKKEHFTSVKIPKNNLGNLDQVGVYWKDRGAVIGYHAIRSYRGGEMLLRQDVTTPSDQNLNERLAENEVARWVPVNSNTFVPERVNPGDLVSFIIAPLKTTPTKLTGKKTSNQTTSNIIGPFRILMLGSRDGKKKVQRASGLSSGSEHILTISVRYENGQLEPNAKRLFDQLQQTGFKGVHVMLHSAKYEPPATPTP